MAKFTRAEIRNILGDACTEEIENRLVALHLGVVDPLKDDLTKYKADAEKLLCVQKELDDLKAAGDGGYKEKYEKEHSDFEAYKSTSQKRKARRQRKKLSVLTLRAKTSPARISTLLCAAAARKWPHWSWTARKSRTPRPLMRS